MSCALLRTTPTATSVALAIDVLDPDPVETDLVEIVLTGMVLDVCAASPKPSSRPTNARSPGPTTARIAPSTRIETANGTVEIIGGDGDTIDIDVCTDPDASRIVTTQTDNGSIHVRHRSD